MSSVAVAGMPRTIGPRRMGLLIALASESIVFFSIVAAYVAGQGYRQGPNPHELLDAARMIPFSLALWLSSLTIWLASRSRLRLWLAVTFVLGAIFLGGELNEWLSLFGDQVTAQSNVWSTTFFSLTGLHGIHVAIGLILMLSMLGLSTRRHLTHDGESAFELVSIYWHFVDGMWVLIYSVVYIWSAFLGG
ncbi:MAG: heme-copper oxidase subunit III [Chloroflexi bacterium]|nr:heme-copper oxidase subunit III [Chloroflexota bacterium]